MNTKFEKTANILDVILKVLSIISVVGIVMCAIAIPVLMFFGDDFMGTSIDVSIGGISLDISDASQYVDTSRLVNAIVGGLVGALLYLVLFIYGIRVVRQIIMPMKESRPFNQGTASLIRRLAIVILIGGFIGAAVEVVVSTMTMNAINVEALLGNTAITGASLDIALNGEFIITALVVFLLSYVFQYGEVLQKESDETL